jgi:cyclic pyranopterin phosphate synthase
MASKRQAASLTHVDTAGRLRMVDVGDKPVTAREATATGLVTISPEALRLVRGGQVKKGNPLEAARLAGIMAAKRTSEIIPLCHPVPLTHVSVDFTSRQTGYEISATARTTARTGVEMEALTAVAAAALTLYDMLKAVDRTMVIGEIRLLEKKGGRSGHFRAPKRR